MTILKPTDQGKNLIIRIPVTLSERLAALQERAKTVGLCLDLDAALSHALARLLKAADLEIERARNKNAGGGDGH